MGTRLTLGVRTWLHIARIAYTIERRATKHLEQHGLTLAQFGVLAQLSAAPGLSQQQLAERLFVTKGNVVGLLDRMVCRGLLERRPCPVDGRVHHIYLTDRGQQLAAQVIPEHEALIAEQIAVIDQESQRDLHRLVHMLDRSLKR